MDRHDQKPSNEFSLAELQTETRRVLDHAAAHGTAVVKSNDGRVQVFIHTPTTDLPPSDPKR
jgi:hypothetical protein